MILASRVFPWREMKRKGWTVLFAGKQGVAEVICSLLDRLEPGKLLEDLAPHLAGLKGHFAFAAENESHAVAVADGVRSFPLFYSEDGTSGPGISNSARLLRDELNLRETDSESLLELQMAVYVTGRDTVYENLYQIQAGEVMVWDKSRPAPERGRYFVFYESGTSAASAEELTAELAERTDAIFRRTVSHCSGKNVWVPLSGGLDSRLVLCKLKEHGCGGLQAFSWGVPGNREAAAAKRVAEALEVPWQFVPDTGKKARKFFFSQERRRYWEFADGLSVVPNLNQVCALRELMDKGEMKQGDVVVNGQSGDFIAGAHLPSVPGPFDEELLLNRIILKHYSHRKDLMTPGNVERMKARILALIREHAHKPVVGEQEFAKQYELWEWQERQAKRVVNGQRNYDFLGLGWELPLWDREYLDFWRGVPVEHKKDRRLFVKYVEHSDFYGMFKNFKPRMSRWPGARIGIQYFGHGVKLLIGPRVSSAYYEALDYFSQYGNLFAHLSYPEYLRLSRKCKGPLSMYALRWIDENVGSGGRGASQ